jgi:Zn-dependent protease with chaperone function
VKGKNLPSTANLSRILGLLLLTLPIAGAAALSSPLAPAPQSTQASAPAQNANPSAPPASPNPLNPQTAADSRSTSEYHLDRDRYDKAIAYSRAGYILYFISVLWSFLVLLFLLRQGIIAKLRDFALAAGQRLILQSLAFIPPLLLLLAVLDLPILIYWHILSLRYQQSVQGWPSWFWDWTKGELLTIALAIPVAYVLILLIRKKPKTWWLYAWFAAIPLALFLFFISPWFIDPLFNKFEPLLNTHPQLVESIGKLSQRAGIPIPPDRMFLMQASTKTNTINAYVTGLGASKRIVIWDTSIQKTTPNELLFIVGHEMGHYVLGHVVKGFAFFLTMLLVALYVAYRLLQWLLARRGRSWGISGQSDWAALGALLLILNVLSFFGEPIGNAFSRVQEHAADVYGLELIHGSIPYANEVAAHAFQVLGEEDLSDPNPSKFITFWLYSHPPLADRLAFAHNYNAWSNGHSPQYVK